MKRIMKNSFLILITLTLGTFFVLKGSDTSAAYKDGTLITSPVHPSVYKIENNTRRPFVNEVVFKTWHENFSAVQEISVEALEAIELGTPMPVKQNTKLLKFPFNPNIYTVSENDTLRHIPNRLTAEYHFGVSWELEIIELPEVYSLFYTKGAALADMSDHIIHTPLDEEEGGLSAVWANTGEDKVIQEDTRMSDGKDVTNLAWDGEKIKLFGARNEMVSFNLVLEAVYNDSGEVSILLDALRHEDGDVIASRSVGVDESIFNWVGRNVELFFVRYLEIKGVSKFLASGLAYPNGYNHLPERWRGENWNERKDHNTHYPDIAVPLEFEQGFVVKKGNSQSIWGDVYIPKDIASGSYFGEVIIIEKGAGIKHIPIELEVFDFMLPDEPHSKTMLYVGNDSMKRYLDEDYAWTTPGLEEHRTIRDRHFMLAHRHKISLVDNDTHKRADEPDDQPGHDWIPRLSGELFTAAHGYDGPGVSTPNDIYTIGMYGSWGWRGEGKEAMWEHTNKWADWFAKNSPQTDYFLYLIDESNNYDEINTWSKWINDNPGSGKQVKSFATLWLPSYKHTPELDIPASTMSVGDPAVWGPRTQELLDASDKKFFMYNGSRPGSGSFVTEDDGVALRELAWGQYKKDIDRWFYWESTYYNNFQGGTGQTDVFNEAFTFGTKDKTDTYHGQTGWNYSNGDGVLFYPGTDRIFPESSYDVAGPFASLRLKHWRRGIQDVDYLSLAKQKDPAATQAIVDRIVPKVLWEYGVDEPSDPTYVTTEISWSDDPDVWEAARRDLAEIILK